MREDSHSAERALLAGLRIVSARTTVEPEPTLSRLYDALQAHGAVVADLPLVRIDLLVDRTWESSAKDIASYSWLCVTSDAAVNVLARVQSQHGLNLQGKHLVAVGGGAADALEQIGWFADVHASAATTVTSSSALKVAASVAELLVSRDDVDGAKILVLSSEELAAPLAMNLSALGMSVTTVSVSRMTPDVHLSDTLGTMIDERTADMFLVTSPSAVDMLNDAIAPERTGRFPMVCVGKQTARAARAAGFAVQVETEYANGPALVRAILARPRK